MSVNTVAVRMPEMARDTLRDVAHAMGVTMQDLLVELIAEAEHRLFFKQMELGYAELASDPEAMKSERDFVETLDAAVADGIEESPDVCQDNPRGCATV